MIELTAVGWLQVAGLVLGLLMGGQAQPIGLKASFDPYANALYITPLVVVWMPELPMAQAITLGGTILQKPITWRYCGGPYGICEIDQEETQRLNTEVIRYELGHVEGWNAFGLSYTLEVLRDPCIHDPAWFCLERGYQRPYRNLVPTTGAIKVVLP